MVSGMVETEYTMMRDKADSEITEKYEAAGEAYRLAEECQHAATPLPRRRPRTPTLLCRYCFSSFAGGQALPEGNGKEGSGGGFSLSPFAAAAAARSKAARLRGCRLSPSCMVF